MTTAARARVERRLKTALPAPVKDGAYAAVRAYALSTSRLRRRPDYLIIGAKRCGTTSLHRYLLQHPSISATFPAAKNIKGVHYFDRQPLRSTRWYASHFPVRPAGQLAGEASPYYLYHPLAAARAAAVVPDARLIVLLRDPAHRAWSHYRDEVKNGRETLSFAQAVDLEKERTAEAARRLAVDDAFVSRAHEHHTYVTQGFYAGHLRRWLQHYPAAQLCVLRSEDMFADPEAVHRTALAFLGLPAVPLPAYHRANASPPVLDPDERSVLDRLRTGYAEPNRELEQLLGRSMGWGA